MMTKRRSLRNIINKAMKCIICLLLICIMLIPAVTASANTEAKPGSREAVTQFVTNLYAVMLDRKPDPEGLNYWVGLLMDGKASGFSVAQSFMFSEELESRNLTNKEFVEKLYKGILGRNPDIDGFEYWVGCLNSGVTKHDVLRNFTRSDEFAAICVAVGISVDTISPNKHNSLTGRPLPADKSNARPWVVSIGNTKDALPMHGIAKADIIWEFVVESATRILALFQDVSNVGQIGSLRSARTSSLDIARSYNALFVHAGGRDNSNELITGFPTAHGTIDVLSTNILSYRDQYRLDVLGIDAYHNLMTTGELLSGRIGRVGVKTEHTSSFDNGLRFTANGTPAGGKNAENVTVRFFRNSKITSFKYSTGDKLYYARQFDDDMKDGNETTKLTFTNVLVLQTEMSFNINESGHTAIKTTGTGTGYYINGGKYIEINWSRANASAPFIYMHKNGTPLALGVGKTYICMVSNTQTPAFS